MYLGSTKYIINKDRKDRGYNTNFFNTKLNTRLTHIAPDSSDERYVDIHALYRAYKGYWVVGGLSKEERLKAMEEKYRTDLVDYSNITTDNQKTVLTDVLGRLMNFFSEFEFEPNFRFVNTFAFCLQDSKKAANEYITNYFKLTASPHTDSIVEKMKSAEFSEITEGMKAIAPTHRVNNRFKVYYGSQGTGKTTDAVKEADNLMVCHSAMLPSDLMEDFQFNDGKATFTPSALMKAMTEGKKIVLDEINLLPFESLRFLQSILDGKSEFMYKGVNVKIKEGFKIIGTMNLTVNDAVYSLPEPLVDRCEAIREYKLTASDLVGAIL